MTLIVGSLSDALDAFEAEFAKNRIHECMLREIQEAHRDETLPENDLAVFDAGFAAFDPDDSDHAFLGLTCSENPYPRESDERRYMLWRAGWYLAWLEQ